MFRKEKNKIDSEESKAFNRLWDVFEKSIRHELDEIIQYETVLGKPNFERGILEKESNSRFDYMLDKAEAEKKIRKIEFKFYVDQKTGEIFDIEILRRGIDLIAYIKDTDKVIRIGSEYEKKSIFDNEVEALMKANEILTSKTKKK